MSDFWILIGFHVFILLMLALDLGVFQRTAHKVTLKESAAWSLIWISLAFIFAAGVAFFRGRDSGVDFVAGYLIEKSLSVDNLFVFLVIFRYFCVPEALRHRILFWGIIGALFMRAGFILIGEQLLKNFHWMMYVFGFFLIYTGIKLLRAGHEELDPGQNKVLRLARRILPISDSYESTRFWVRHGGKLFATPMFLVLLVIESTDVIFAIDSIPAIFAITTDTFIVYTSNIFAILGLRAMYFLLADFLGMFRYLNVGLAGVLTFVGVKMVIKDPIPAIHWPGFDIKSTWSLVAVAVILGMAILASLVSRPRKEIIELPPTCPVEPTPEVKPSQLTSDS